VGGCCLQWGVEVEHRRRRLRARVAGGWRRQRQWSGDRRRRIVGGVGGGAGGGVTGMASGRAGRGPPFAGKGHSGWVRRGSAGEQGWSAPRERRLLRVVGGYLRVTSPWSATAPRARTPPPPPPGGNARRIVSIDYSDGFPSRDLIAITIVMRGSFLWRCFAS